MNQHADTAFHAPIVLADERIKRRVRPGPAVLDLPTPVPRAPYRGETKDERAERLMNRLEAPIGRSLPFEALRSALCWLAFPAACFGAALWLFTR